MKTLPILLTTSALCFLPVASAKDCRSCAEHRAGGSISYGNGYYPGGVYPNDYRQYYRGYPGNTYYQPYGWPQSGSITHTCGSGNMQGKGNKSYDGCVTRYHGPASDIQQLPRIHREIRRTQPSRISIPGR